MNAYIALDIGGTQIKSAIIAEDNRLASSIRIDDAHSKEDAPAIISNFAHIIRIQLSALTKQGLDISGIGIAFPGPFDYANGISYMQGINKYDAIYGLNLKDLLAGACNLPVDLIAFMNDADLFCLGEAVFGKGAAFNRSMMICIGTGLGSGFIANGKLIKQGNTVPENGWIYNLPYKDGIVDQYLSATGLHNMIQASGYFDSALTVKEASELARKGDKNAIRIFQQFGKKLEEVIPPIAARFQAECVIIGGQVAKSYDLFYNDLAMTLEKAGITTCISEDSSASAMRAVPLLFCNT